MRERQVEGLRPPLRRSLVVDGGVVPGTEVQSKAVGCLGHRQKGCHRVQLGGLAGDGLVELHAGVDERICGLLDDQAALAVQALQRVFV